MMVMADGHSCSTETNAWYCCPANPRERERLRTVNNNIFPCSVLQLWALIAFGACMGFWTLALLHVWPALKALFRLFWILKAAKEILPYTTALCLCRSSSKRPDCCRVPRLT